MKELRDAKYFSVIVDSTPDLSHVDQLTYIFRFVNSEGRIVERFVGFEPISSHRGESLADCVISMVQQLGLDLENCRGQSYDNASNMSGKYNGLQAHLKKQNPLIHYVPCAAHSLNLVGVNSVEDCSDDVGNYFDFMQSLYNFAAASTHRWEKMFGDDRSQLTLKALSNTRWSCRAESAKALWQHYNDLHEKLKRLSVDEDEKRETRSEASALCKKFQSLETAFMAKFWDTVLSRFHATSTVLQRSDLSLDCAVRSLQSLCSFVSAQRDLFEDYERAAKSVPGVNDAYKHDVTRQRKRKTFFDEASEESVELGGKRRFQVHTFNVAIDRLAQSLRHRLEAYKELYGLFSALYADQGESDVSVMEKARVLAAAYPSDLDQCIGEELIQLRSFSKPGDDTSPKGLLGLILEYGLESMFPNVYVALRMFLTLPVTNCEGERSFSLLGRVKNELRTKMKQERLSWLSLMAIESELTKSLDFDDIIQEFAQRKVRRRCMQ